LQRKAEKDRFNTKDTKVTVRTEERRTCASIAKEVARNKGFTYYGYMNITLSLPDELVKRVRKIAVDRDTTLTGLVREYLNELARQEAAAGRKRREREALDRSFEQFQYRVGNRTWKREDLHERA
jgi:predicted transcriptional regulator